MMEELHCMLALVWFLEANANGILAVLTYHKHNMALFSLVSWRKMFLFVIQEVMGKGLNVQ